jgi:hypothetical protein
MLLARNSTKDGLYVDRNEFKTSINTIFESWAKASKSANARGSSGFSKKYSFTAEEAEDAFVTAAPEIEIEDEPMGDDNPFRMLLPVNDWKSALNDQQTHVVFQWHVPKVSDSKSLLPNHTHDSVCMLYERRPGAPSKESSQAKKT